METSADTITRIIAAIGGKKISGALTLEPSAGQGKLAEVLRNHGAKVHVCELNIENIDVLINKGFPHVARDFLEYKPDLLYDLIVAVPPYKDNIDCFHIQKMYSHLKKGGRLVSLTLPHWITGMFTVQRKFRRFLLAKKYKLELLPDTDESYLSAPKMIIVIDK